ncbi:bifunctional protein-serine/threonine kinase/phosphatase [Paracoccus sp. JM45]|uniref:bifunctional protein-serine/threonine kinase/phosphatase n=1 Tax=Paracoccus sp. JM45 TaxID=2283626 RepID=UPI001C7226D1|nr:bifunctional protein-serine/threonine kinase/phosphatase [Paracoccus sp. JM45]
MKDDATLAVSIGHFTGAGRKPENQDAIGSVRPTGRKLALKGAAFAIADGISSSAFGQEAAETSVAAFLTDYYCTPDSWSVRSSAGRVIAATNAWLHGQTLRSGARDSDKGYVCTFAGLVLKGHTAHVLHVGDSRVWHLRDGTLEPLTWDHRSYSDGRSYLARALGVAPQVEVDYREVPLREGDVFIMTTDGVHDWLHPCDILNAITPTANLMDMTEVLAQQALDHGSDDNLSMQILRIDALPDDTGDALLPDMACLPVPPLPAPGAMIDGFRIIRHIHATSRSHVFLASGPDGARVALKIPSTETRDDPAAIRRLLMEEWIARRIDNPHVLRAIAPSQPRTALYVVTEWIEGRTLRQWMHDTPTPDFDAVRDILSQIVTGLRAFHRREMLYQDLRPENIMIDHEGTVKIIDFGAVWVAGVVEAAPSSVIGYGLGTWQYTAPEYLSGDAASWRSDLYALGTIAYEMLRGQLPYGTRAARVQSRRDAARLVYRSVRADERSRVPAWMDAALKRAVHPDPLRRHDAMSEFLAELRAPTARTRPTRHQPLMERAPLRFWQGMSACLTILLLASLVWPRT